MSICCLCQSLEVSLFQMAPYFRCNKCYLIFKDSTLHLSSEEEKKRYDLHQNNINDPAYVNFLWPVVQQIKRNQPHSGLGLDFGCGPNPVLSQLLEKEHYQMYFYDPYYFATTLSEFKDQPLRTFDFITCTEAAEHFYQPGKEFKKIFSWLKPGGHLLLMTDLYQEGQIMNTWGYARDPSHVCFFSELNLRWLAKVHDAELELVSNRLVHFTL